MEAPNTGQEDARVTRRGRYSAWLKKAKSENARCKLLQSHNTRYFTIDFDSQIIFYSHSTSQKKVSQPIPFRDILGAERLPLPTKSRKGKNAMIYGFILRTKPRLFELFTNSSTDAAQWTFSLNAAMEMGLQKAEKAFSQEGPRVQAQAPGAILEEEAVPKRPQDQARREQEEPAVLHPQDAEAAVQRQQEETTPVRPQEEEAARRQKEEDEAKARRQQAETTKKEEDAARRIQEEEAAARKTQEEEAAARKMQEEEAAARKMQEEEAAAKKKQEEKAAARKMQEEEAAARKTQEEQAAARKMQEEEAAARKTQEEEAAARQMQEEEAAAKKKQEEEAAARKEEEAAARKTQEEDAAKKQAEVSASEADEIDLDDLPGIKAGVRDLVQDAFEQGALVEALALFLAQDVHDDDAAEWKEMMRLEDAQKAKSKKSDGKHEKREKKRQKEEVQVEAKESKAEDLPPLKPRGGKLAPLVVAGKEEG